MGTFSGVDGSTGSAQAYTPQEDANAPSPNNFGEKVEAQQREHVVRRGESLSLIAKESGITLTQLLALNTQFDANSVDKGRSKKRAVAGKRDADQLRIGEKVFVPAASGTGVEGVAKPVNLQTSTANTRVNESPYRAGSKPPQNSTQQQAVTTTPAATTKTTTPAATTTTTTPAATTATTTPAATTATTTPAATTATTTDPTPAPTPAPPEVLPAAYKRYLLLTGSGSGSKDPRSADNRAGAIFESNDFGGNLNSGSYQFNASLTKPGRVQEPGARLDATARVSLFSAGRKPAKYLDAEGKEKTTEAFGLKLGGMNAKDRFMSVSAYANVSGVPIGAIEQETGKAVDGKSATSPLHIGPAVSIGGQSGGLTGFYAPGIGNGQIRNADGTISTTHTNIYGIDYGVTFAEKPKFALARLQAGMTGRRTVTTPQGGEAGKPTYANTFSAEAFFKFPGKIPSLLPGQPESRTNDAPGLFRIKLDTPFDKLDPKLTLRFDKPIWEIRNVVPTADGKLKVTSQFQMEVMGAAQFGLNSQKDPAVQNVVAGLRFRF